MFGRVDIGDHVLARRDISAGLLDPLLGLPTVSGGRRGIVREVRRGLFSDRLVVEFDCGWTTQAVADVRSGDIRAAWLGHGEQSWERRRDARIGIRLGLLALAIPGLVAAGLYLAQGGSLADLVGASIVEMVVLALSIVRELGLVLALVLLATATLARKLVR